MLDFIKEMYNDLSTYKSYVTESLETFLTTNPFQSSVMLYHGSDKKLDIIKPMRINVGTKISKPRMSSFWGTDPHWCKAFAVQTLCQNNGFQHVWLNLVMKTMWKEDKYTEDIICRLSEKEKIEKLLKSKKIYLYSKNMDKRYLGIGHNAQYQEYSIDFPVKPDNIEVLSYNDFKDVTFKFISDEEYEKILLPIFKKYANSTKKHGDGKWLKYTDSERKEIRHELKSFAESDDPKTQCFEDFKKYSKDNSHIHPLDHVKTHSGKKDTYLLFATADSVNGSYKPLIEGLKKNVKYNGNDADWHSIYLPGDVFLAIKVGKEITESTDVKDKKVKNIIFDFGAVLVDYKSDAEFLKAFEPYRLSKSEIDTLRKIYFDFVPNDETASLEDSVYCYKKKLPENLQKYAVKAFEVFSTNNKPFDYTVPILKDLKRKGYKIYYLSNWGRASFTLMKDHHIMDFINLFNGGIVSYEVGFTKPHKEIYQLLIKKYNLDPSECIFYDDKKENCEAARKEGMRSVLFSHDIVNEILQLPNLNAEIRESYNELYLDALSIVEDGTEYDYNFNIDIDDITLEAATDTHIMMENLYPKVSDILSTPVGDRKFKQMVGAFMDRNSMKLHTAGPTYLVPFADRDKAEFFNLFKLDQKYVKKLIKDVTNKIGSGSQFKLLSDNPIYWVFYCCIRYYTMKKDTKGLNTALSIYALSNYPSVFHMSFPYPPNAAVMQYTMDNLSEKYIMKQAGHVFGGLFLSIQHSYEFLKPYMADASDKEIIRFIQRIRNDQKSMMKNICDQYMKNHAAGRRVKLNLDSHEGIQIDDDNENNTTVVQTVADNVVNRLITSGLDLRRVSQCKDIAQIGMADCRFYLSKIVTDKYVKEITAFIYSVLFLYLYDEKKTKQDINSTYFLKWSAELFRKTNSNNPNIRNIKETLDKWGEETGVHAKFKREASRVNYKKAIFWYFILSIQYYNK